MRPILSPLGREVLQIWARSEILLGFDFDGTLVPIVSRPEQAALPGSTRALLRTLSKFYPWIVISGRARADVARRLENTGVTAVYGNHGLEAARGGKPALVATWRREIAQRLAGHPGIVIEDKGLSLAVHYRESRPWSSARVAIMDATSRLPSVRVMGGKAVVNVLPAGAGNKGLAMVRARSAAGCDTALYVGDDETDEDVFSLDQPGQLLTIRVGRARTTSRAGYVLPRQADIDTLLRVLIAARNPRAR